MSETPPTVGYQVGKLAGVGRIQTKKLRIRTWWPYLLDQSRPRPNVKYTNGGTTAEDSAAQAYVVSRKTSRILSMKTLLLTQVCNALLMMVGISNWKQFGFFQKINEISPLILQNHLSVRQPNRATRWKSTAKMHCYRGKVFESMIG